MGFNIEDYEPVSSRLDRWLKDNPSGRVITDLVHYLSDVAVFRAELWLNGEIIATGWAEEIRGQGNVNRTSHVENAETSAIGRALSNAGLAGSDPSKRPSREEMAKVQRMTTTQGETTISRPANAPSDKQLWLFKKLLKEAGKLPPLNVDSMDKFEVSRAIEALKANEEPDYPPLPEEEPF